MRCVHWSCPVVWCAVAGGLQRGRCPCGGGRWCAWSRCPPEGLSPACGAYPMACVLRCSGLAWWHCRCPRCLCGGVTHAVRLQVLPGGAVPGQGFHLKAHHQRAGCHLMACAFRCSPGGVARAVRVSVLPCGVVVVVVSGACVVVSPMRCVCGSCLVACCAVAGALQHGRCCAWSRVHLKAYHQRAGRHLMACVLRCPGFAWWRCRCPRCLCSGIAHVVRVWVLPGGLLCCLWCRAAQVVLCLVKGPPERLSPACRACPHSLCGLPSVLCLVPCSVCPVAVWCWSCLVAWCAVAGVL